MSAADPTAKAPQASDRPAGTRRAAAAAILLSLVVVVVAERDLNRRPSAQIRGPKALWRLGSTNALVALAYLRWGRQA